MPLFREALFLDLKSVRGKKRLTSTAIIIRTYKCAAPPIGKFPRFIIRQSDSVLSNDKRTLTLIFNDGQYKRINFFYEHKKWIIHVENIRGILTFINHDEYS